MLLLPVLVHADLIPATDPRIVAVGRFDTSDPKGIACQWSASEVRLRVKGAELKISFSDSGEDYVQAVVDGVPTSVLKPTKEPQTVSLALGASAEHVVRLVKRTEAWVGTLTYQGFELPDGTLLPAARKPRNIEVVGDSITCGYGNEGANQNEKFKTSTENAYLSYASVAARAVDADVTILAWSGRKMWPDNTVPEIYDRILPTVEKPLYDFGGPAPDAVVINLATNDFGVENPAEAPWTAAYEAFVRRVWSHYPKARVYAAIGSMMNDNWPPNHQSLTTLRGYLTRLVDRVHDPRLQLIEFPPQDSNDGLGSDWHPNVKTHEKMGKQLAAVLAKDLSWSAN